MSTASTAAAISTAAARPPIVGDPSPWGAIDGVEPLADGVVFVCTPSHGGAWLSPAAQARIRHRAITMRGVFTFDLERTTDPGAKAKAAAA